MPHLSRGFFTAHIALTAVLFSLGLGLDLSAAPAITATKDDGIPTGTKVIPGSTVTYTNTIANGTGAGITDATGVQFRDPNTPGEIPGTTYVANSLTATPVALDDLYPSNVVANTSVNTAASSNFSVVDNDFTGFASGTAVVKTALTITAYDAATTGAGTVNMVTTGANVGKFTYTPAAGFIGTDTFTYTISNAVPGGTAESATAVVRIPVAGPAIWFVNANAATNGTGTLASPFNNLASFRTINDGAASHPKAGDTVFLYESATDYTGGITLLGAVAGGQRLIGQDASGTLAALSGISFPADAPSLPAMDGGNSTFARVVNSGGNGVTVQQNCQLHGFTVGSSVGAAITGGSGTLAVTAVTVNNTHSTNGGGLSLGSVNFGASSSFVSVTSVSGSAGISLGSITGAVNFGGGALSGHTGSGFSCTGGAANLSYSGSISKTTGSGAVISISNKSGGTVAFSGAISSSVGGIVLATNPATIFGFTGGLAISSGTSPAFSATGGGTVTATQDNNTIINTLATTTGTPLTVTGTAVGSAGLAFRSIASSGAAAGVIINAPGSAGGFTVAGTGAAGTGGTIQGSTGTGISVTSVSPVSLSSMNIQNGLDDGINVATVTGLTLASCSVTNNGNTTTDEGIELDNVGGGISITGTTVTGSAHNNLYLDNINTNISTLTISGSTFGSNDLATGNHGVLMEIRGTSQLTTGTFSTNTVNDNVVIGMQVTTADTATISAFTVSGCTFRDTGLGNSQEISMDFSRAQTSNLTVSVLNNLNITGHNSQAMNFFSAAGTGTAGIYNARIEGNIIGINANAGSGSVLGNGIRVNMNGDSTNKIVINNNQVYETPNGRGIEVIGRNGLGSSDVTVTNNTVDHTHPGFLPGGGAADFPLAAIFMQTNTVTVSGQRIRADVRGNTVPAVASSDLLPTHIALLETSTTTFELVDVAPASANATDQLTSANTGTASANAGVALIAGSINLPPLLVAAGGIEKASLPPPVSAAAVAESAFPGEASVSPMALANPAVAPEPALLLPEELDAAVTAAIARWEATGLTGEQVRRLRSMKFEIGTLTHNHLGEAGHETIHLDATAGGNGWFVDASDASDALFGKAESATRRLTDPYSAPAGRMDLLTTVMHEMGHALGLSDSYASADRESIMYGQLIKGERRLPAKDQAKGATPFHGETSHFLTAGATNPLAIGTLPPGKSVVITYQVKVNDPPTILPISSQATIRSTTSSFTDVLTDDPTVAGAANATITQVELPDVSVAVDPASVMEDGTGTLAYTFTRVGSIAAPLTASFNVTGSAAFSTDYTESGALTFGASAGTVTFAANSATAVVTISPTDDATVELDETVVLTIAPSAAYDVVAPTSATGTITNDDTSVSVAVSPSSVAEDGAGNITYTFTRQGVTTGTLVANFSVGGTATLTTDYTQTGATSFAGSSGTVTFAPAVLTATVVVDPVADNSVEPDETIVLTPAAGTGYNADITAASGAIPNDDSTVKVELLADTSVTEDGVTNLVYTFTRTGATTNALAAIVNVSGTAGFTGDYTHNIGSFSSVSGQGLVNFAAGSSVATVTINPTTDTSQETDETVIITLADNNAPSAAGGYEVGTPSSRTGTIVDDDLPVVSVAVTTAASTEGGAAGVYTFTRNSTTGPLTAAFALDASSTADAEIDFTLAGSGVTFDASTGTGTIGFPDTVGSVEVTLNASAETAIVGGQPAEAEETARLNIVPQAGVYGGTSNATVTIGANGFIVVNTGDSGEGSFRQAVANANSIAGADTVRFSDGSEGSVDFRDTTPETITLLGEVAITTPLVIEGTGAAKLVLSGGNANRVLSAAGAGAVSLLDLSVTNGTAAGGAGLSASGNTQLALARCVVSNHSSSAAGGAISHIGGTGSTLSLNQCSVSSNTTTGIAGGAGIESGAAVTTISGTTFSGNLAASSGGAFRTTATSGPVTITNSTFSGNACTTAVGGAIHFPNPGVLTLVNCTITNNRAVAATGGGINLASGSTLTLHNTLVADNYTGSSPGTTRSDIAAMAVQAISSNNVIGAGNGLTGITNGNNGNQIGTTVAPLAPVIGPLDNSGGPTLTHALLAGSPALNSGSNAAVAVDTFDLDGDSNTAEPVPFDQRGGGFLRSIGTVDIGAVELQKAFSIAADASTFGEGAGTATFTISRVGGTAGDASVTYTVSGVTGNPAAAADFGASLPTGTVTILNGESTASLSIPIVNDPVVEAEESFRVTLSGPASGYAILGSTADTQITDNDAATLSIAKFADGAETNPTATSGVFRVTQSAVSSTATTVNYTIGGTATSGTDFTAPSGTVTIAAGNTSADITIPITRDFRVEVVETITATLSTIGASDPSVTIGTPATASLDILDSAPASIAVSSGSPQSATVNTAFGNLVAVVKDAAGNNLQGASVTFTAPGSGATGTFAASATVLTNASGLATAPTFTANTVAGSYTVTASSVGTPAAFSLTNTPAAATSLAVAAPANATAGTPVSVAVTARDAFGNTAAGYSGTVHFTSGDPLATLPADATLTSGAGTFSTTFATGGSQTITATDTVIASVTGTSGAVSVTPRADLAVTITDGVTTATPGGTVSYTITASNSGPSPVSTVTVTDNLPTALGNVTWTAVGAAGGIVSTPTGSGDINHTVNLPVGASVTYTVTGMVSASATGSLTNTATVSSAVTDPNAANNTATDTDTLAPSANLAITKTDGVITLIPGNQVTYTIVASNAGPSDAPVATVADTLPASLTNVTWTGTGTGGGTATASGSGNINDTVNLPAGGSVTYTVTATVSPSATGTLTNTATVSSAITDPVPANNSATDIDTLAPQADLSITKTDGVTTATPGGSVTYTITVSNAGPSTATGATVADTFPASLAGTWTAVGAGGATGTATGSGNISQSVTLPPGGSFTYTVSAAILPSATGTLSNTATVTVPGGTTDPTPANNSATDTDTLTPQADLVITKTDGVTTAIPGGAVTYTVTVSNAGPSNVAGATVTDTLPAALTGNWTAAVAGGATAIAAGAGNINETVGLPAGGSVIYTVSATISSTATGTLSNTAAVSSVVTDPVPGNNSATDTDTLTPQADVSVIVTDTPDPVDAGANLTYTITVTNSGLSTAGSVTLDNPLPVGTTFVSLSTPGGWSTTTPAIGANGTISASVPSMAVGSAVFTLVVKVDYLADGAILTNTATVATATDPDNLDDSATALTTVSAIPEIALFNGASDLAPSIADGAVAAIDYGSTTVGNPITRTFTVKNVGTGTLSLVSVTPPTGFSLLAPVSPQSVAPTASLSFAVRYDAGAIGAASGSLVIASNDTDEASFDFPITATRTNVVPTANAQTLATDEDIALPIILTGSDPDVGQTLAYTVTATPANGALSGTAPNVTYTPNANYNGSDAFSFRINDGTANSPTVSVTLTINALNDVPVALAQNLTTNEDTALPITLAGTDVENSPLAYSISTPPTNGTLSGTPPNVTYTPGSNYNGSDSFAFIVNDGTIDSAPATISITVDAVNDVPVAVTQAVSTDEDMPLPVTLTGTDVENSPLTYSISTPPAHGTLSGTPPNVTYTPNANYNGADSFAFIVNDGTIDSAPATVSITVDTVNDVPVAVAQSVSTNEDTALPITLTGTDVENSPLAYSISTPPTSGTLSGTLPNVTYTPGSNFNGADSFAFIVNDGTIDSTPATISITINAVNDVPVAVTQAVSSDEDTPLPVTLTGTDVENSPLTYSISTPPAHGALSGTPPNVTYTPDADYNGPDGFAFVVNDGTIDSAPATVPITVDAVNDVPVAVVQGVSTNEDTALPITLTGTDVENSPLIYSVSTLPGHGTLSGTPPNLTYTPDSNYNGSDSFAFIVNDGMVDSIPAAISITINAVNDVPVAVVQTVSTDEDTPLPVTLTGTDVENSVLTYSISTPPANGTLSGIVPNVTYTPNANYNGADSFAFIVNDGTVDSAPATISITVNAVNDPPTLTAAIPDVLQVTPGNSTMIVLPPYFSDVETASSGLTYTASVDGPFFTASITAGVLTITSTAPGIADLTITATDPDTGSVSDTFRITVKHVPEIAGSGVPDTVLSPAAPDQTIDLAGYFLDQDNDALTYAVVSNSDISKASYVPSGSMLTLHPLAPGSTTFTVSATDVDGNSVQDSFVVTVEDPIPVITPTAGFTPKVNNQTGLFEVSVTATNNNLFDIPGFRFRVTSAMPAGITLRNSTGPAGAFEPYLDVLTHLSPGESVVVLMEFQSPTRNFTGFNPTIVAEPLPAGLIDAGTGLGIDVTLVRVLPGSAGVLLEFTSEPGRFYQLEYSPDLNTWKKCLVPIHAGANRVQWIDRGPPYTDSPPPIPGNRYYRVSRID